MSTETKWHNAAQKIRDFVVQIQTPNGSGTGFVVQPPPDVSSDKICVITAWHVISHAQEWGEQIKIGFVTGKSITLLSTEREVNPASSRDQAFILFEAKEMCFPKTPPLVEKDRHFVEGVEVGWFGFPAIAPTDLCFFHGYISCWRQEEEGYLVDGVAINGVSGGPAFALAENGIPVIAGLVTEYRPNLSRGTPLPGLTFLRSINPYVQHNDVISKKLQSPKIEGCGSQQVTSGS